MAAPGVTVRLRAARGPTPRRRVVRGPGRSSLAGTLDSLGRFTRRASLAATRLARCQHETVWRLRGVGPTEERVVSDANGAPRRGPGADAPVSVRAGGR